MLNKLLQWQLDRVTTPLGVMLLVTDAQNTLHALDWADSEARMLDRLRLLYGADGVTLTSGPAPQPVRNGLEAYWAGDLNAVSAIPAETAGTEFQQAAWAWLRSIPAAEKPAATRNRRGAWTGHRRCVPWGVPTERIPLVLSFPAIASSAPTAP